MPLMSFLLPAVLVYSALCNIGMSCATVPTTSLPCAVTLDTLSKHAEYKVCLAMATMFVVPHAKRL